MVFKLLSGAYRKYVLLFFIFTTLFSSLYYYFGKRNKAHSAIPIVMYNKSITKIKPKDPGGWEAPNMDKAIYNNLNSPEQLGSIQFLEESEKPLRPLMQNLKDEKTFEEISREIDKEIDKEIAAEFANEGSFKEKDIDELGLQNIFDLEVNDQNHGAATKEIKSLEPNSPELNSQNSNSKKNLNAEKNLDIRKIGLTSINSIDVNLNKPAQEIKQMDENIILEDGLNVIVRKSQNLKEVAAYLETGKYIIQLGVFAREKDAISTKDKIYTANKNLIKKYTYSIKKEKINDNDIVYKIELGTFENFNKAAVVCKKLSIPNQRCIVVKE